MTITRISILLCLALACGCWRAGTAPAPKPPGQRPLATTRGPCLSQPPPTVPRAVLDRIDAGTLTPDEEREWLWSYVEVLERRIRRDWALCGTMVTQ